MSDSCKCMDIVRQKLEAYHGEGSEVELCLVSAIDTATFETSAELPPLHYTYKAGNKRKKSYVTFAFCPFCGVKK